MLNKATLNKATYMSVSDAAKDEILKRVQSTDGAIGIKIDVIRGGCSGLSYQMEYANKDINVSPSDDILSITDNVSLFINSKNSLLFYGTVLDYYDNGIEYGFKFVNPNEKSKCGCGKSFAL